MSDLHHFWNGDPVFQAGGTTMNWTWVIGENQHYYGFSVRPWQFNSDAEILRQWTTTDNGNSWIENFVIKTDTGNLFRFSAIQVVG
jgi:hypothetical protein